jgi:carboxyl-terminal processing protease
MVCVRTTWLKCLHGTWRQLSLPLALLCAWCPLTAVGASGPPSNRTPAREEHFPQSVTAEASTDSLEIAVSILRETLLGVRALYVEDVPVDHLLQAALEGIRERLDPHTKVLSVDEFASLRAPGTRTVGIGVALTFGSAHPFVREVLDGSPAERAGLLPGDRLLRVDGRPLTGLERDGATELLTGMPDSVLDLLIETPEGERRSVSLNRAPLLRDLMTGMLLAGDRVGYIWIRRFGCGASSRLETILRDWAPLRLEGLVIDLRGNPGGFLDEAVWAADLFLPPGEEIVRSEGRLPEETGTFISRRQPVIAPSPCVILVDSLTASSAEIFTGALKGALGALLLGQPTYGKRSVQRIVPLEAGGALKVTAAFFRTPADQDSAGPRLRPDHVMAPPELPPPWNWVEERGLLARFVRERSLATDDPEHMPFWAAATPPSGPDRWLGAAPGFEVWRGRLEARLRGWGAIVSGDSRVPSISDGQGERAATGEPRQLRRLWLIDWITECWGGPAGERAALELDPWVREAVRLLKQPRVASAAAIRERPSSSSH